MTLPLAAFGDDVAVFALLIPISAILVTGLTIVVSMFMKHQRQMAELYRQQSAAQPELMDEVKALRFELREMKDRINQQTLMLEDRTGPPSGKMSVQDRISER